MSLPLTPSQTVGPFLQIGLPWPDGPFVVPEGTPGAITIAGVVLDGAGVPVPDALVETWQAGPDGRFDHPDDPRGRPGPGRPSPASPSPASPSPESPSPESPSPSGAAFRGFGRCPTDEAGRYHIVTLPPGPLPCPDGSVEAPHLDVSVFARGLLDRVVTRIYFPEQGGANAADPVLASVDPPRRATLIATAEPGTDGGYRFDIRLRGKRETVFFDV